jgi:mRNA-degrading endonuclease RelE of RelBE toxin-antitoxin system
MAWTVITSNKAQKQIDQLPRRVIKVLDALVAEIGLRGPVRGNWPNYSKLRGERHHCHLTKGKPTYVAVWEVKEKRVKLVEVIYVGTHERARY